MILFVLRGLVLVIITAISVGYLLANQEQGGFSFTQFLILLGITLALAALVIAADAMTPKKKLSAISGVFIGLIVGLIVLLPLAYVVDLVGVLTKPLDPPIELTLDMAYKQAEESLLVKDLPAGLTEAEINTLVAEEARIAIDTNRQTVSYTHLTLPTIRSVDISGVPVTSTKKTTRVD